MNIAIFGGTFDPIHDGHLAVARAARDRYELKQIHFVVADLPPHKQAAPLLPFAHRFAMVALATTGEKEFIPSDIEARLSGGGEPNYSINTVHNFRRTLKKSDRLFFIVGMDAFSQIANWREPEVLLRETEFIIASRPGYSLADVGTALPPSLRPGEAVLKALRTQSAKGDIVLNGATIHLLDNVHERVSATQIRAAVSGKRSFQRLVPPQVAEYIRKTHLYQHRDVPAAPAKVVAMPRRRKARISEGE